MTVENQDNFKRVQGDGVTNTFTFNFRVLQAADLKVYLVDEDNVSTLQTPDTDYEVTLEADGEGGSITFLITEPTADEDVLMRNLVEITQTADLPTEGPFDERAVEAALDRGILIALQQQQELKQSLKIKLEDPLNTTDFEGIFLKAEASRGGKALMWNEDGDEIEAGPLLAPLIAITDQIVLVAENIAALNIVADNLDGVDSIGVVAAINDEIVALYAVLDDLVALAQNSDALLAGKLQLPLAAAAGNTFAKGEIGYITSNGVVKANAASEVTSRGTLVMATTAIAASSTNYFLLRGIQDGLTGLVDEANYWLGTSDGAYSTAQPYTTGSIVRSIGKAIGTTKMSFEPSPTYAPVTGNNQYPPVIVEVSTSGYEPSDGSVTLMGFTDTEIGEYLLLIVGADYTNAATATFTPLAGFTSLAAYTRTNIGAEGVAQQAFYKIATADEPDDYTITEDALQKFAAVLIRISGIDPTYPVDVQAISSDHATEPTIPSITTTVDETVLIAAITWDATKTLQSTPSGYTLIQHQDQTGLDVYVAQKANTLAGVVSSQSVDLSSADDWVAFIFAFKKQGATAGGGGSNVGPFDLMNDGLGYSMKWTSPLNEAGELSEATDAWEVLCSNYAGYDAGDPQLENYVHPIYFLRTAGYYQFASPIRGAYTSSNTNGPARSELRHARNYGPTERIRFKSTIQLIQAAPSAKITCVQIHRVDGSPVIKNSITVDSGGTTFRYRPLVKKVDDGPDETQDANALDLNALTGALFNTNVTVEVDFDPVAQTLKIWFNRANTLSPTRYFTGVQSSGLASYIKPAGVYANAAGTGTVDDLSIVRLIDFVLIDDNGNEIARP